MKAVSALAYDRGGHDEVAFARQAIASVASPDRTEALAKIKAPTLIVHGLADTMCDPSGGQCTAKAIPNSTLVLIEGMGHNLPPGLWDRLADHITTNIQRAR